jgi:intracellular sulfur oxidation DsrE/DsrF family protein
VFRGGIDVAALDDMVCIVASVAPACAALAAAPAQLAAPASAPRDQTLHVPSPMNEIDEATPGRRASQHNGPAAPAARPRRRFITAVSMIGSALGAALLPGRMAAAAAQPGAKTAAAERMPGDPPQHHIVYQLNHAEPEYIEHILNSVGAMITKYEDNVAIAVVAFGPGIHLLATRPGRPVPAALRERAQSQARDYKVRFIACGNTMKSLGWSRADIRDFATIEEVGAAALMELQEQGWAYVAW